MNSCSWTDRLYTYADIYDVYIIPTYKYNYICVCKLGAQTTSKNLFSKCINTCAQSFYIVFKWYFDLLNDLCDHPILPPNKSKRQKELEAYVWVIGFTKLSFVHLSTVLTVTPPSIPLCSVRHIIKVLLVTGVCSLCVVIAARRNWFRGCD